jgi:hypothetical protein
VQYFEAFSILLLLSPVRPFPSLVRLVRCTGNDFFGASCWING